MWAGDEVGPTIIWMLQNLWSDSFSAKMETLKHGFLCYSQVIQPKPVAALGLWNQSFLIAQQLLHARARLA
jgi:hypothetical protein